MTRIAFCCDLHRVLTQDIHRRALSHGGRLGTPESITGAIGGSSHPRRDSERLFNSHLYENDPAAGSPTATLLRLLPLLACKYHRILRSDCSVHSKRFYSQAITGNDGRCVQEPGTYSVRSDETRLQDIPRSRTIIAMIYPHHDTGFKDFPRLSTQAACGSSLSVSV